MIPGLGRSPGGGHDNPLQYSSLENPHGQRSLVRYSPWGHKELDTTDQLSTNTTQTPMSSSPYSRCQTLGVPWRLVVRALCFHCRAHQIDPWSVGKLKFHMMHGLAKRKKKSQSSFSNATFKHTWALLVVQMVKHLPAMRET